MAIGSPAKQAIAAQIFDRDQVIKNRQRAALHLQNHNFLFDWCLEQIIDRLNDIKRDFPKILLIGHRSSPDLKNRLRKSANVHYLATMDMTKDLLQKSDSAVIAEDDFLPFSSDSFDLVISNFSLHSVNDLPGALIQINRILKPDGAFIGALPGENTLQELRNALTQTELTLKNGISPRMIPLVTKQDMGGLMQRAGFALPVVDSQTLSVTYDDPINLIKDIRFMGEANIMVNRNKTYPGKTFLNETMSYLRQNHTDNDGKIAVTFDIIFLIGWAPHKSQQQPLKPGSAKNKLATALKSTEVKL